MLFPFEDTPNTATLICCHILDQNDPILYVSHDEDDGMWQFLCGQQHTSSEARLVSLQFVYELDPSIAVLKDMPCGYYAQRKSRQENWIIRKKENTL